MRKKKETGLKRRAKVKERCSEERLFHRRSDAIGNARSLTVDSRVHTTSTTSTISSHICQMTVQLQCVQLITDMAKINELQDPLFKMSVQNVHQPQQHMIKVSFKMTGLPYQ